MNEVMRYRSLLREAIMSDVNVNELNECCGKVIAFGSFIARVSCCSSPTLSMLKNLSFHLKVY